MVTKFTPVLANSEFTASQLAAPSVLLKSPPEATTYTVLFCGSITTRLRPFAGSPEAAVLQLVPPFVLLKSPPEATRYIVSGFCGSIASVLTGPPSGPIFVHASIPAQTFPDPNAVARIAADISADKLRPICVHHCQSDRSNFITHFYAAGHSERALSLRERSLRVAEQNQLWPQMHRTLMRRTSAS